MNENLHSSFPESLNQSQTNTQNEPLIGALSHLHTAQCRTQLQGANWEATQSESLHEAV